MKHITNNVRLNGLGITDNVLSMASHTDGLHSFSANGQQYTLWSITLFKNGKFTDDYGKAVRDEMLAAARENKKVPVDLRTSNTGDTIRAAVIYRVDMSGELGEMIKNGNRDEAMTILSTITDPEHTELVYNYLADGLTYHKNIFRTWLVFVMDESDTMYLSVPVKYPGQNCSYYTVGHKLYEYISGNIVNGCIELKALTK